MVLKQPGFTLLEMLIVVAIMGALAAAASPFTQEWYNTAKVNEMTGVLQEGSARAKALALSNANVTQGDNIAALLCPENNILYLYAAPPSACGVAGAVWSSRFPEVPSMMVPPGFKRPSASASSIIFTAILSFTEFPGLKVSTLASTKASIPATTL